MMLQDKRVKGVSVYLLEDSSYSSELGVKDSCLSSKVLTADELAILLKGLNFTPTPLPHTRPEH